MKKTYITPALNAVMIDKLLMDSTSMPKSDEGVDEGWSNKYQGGLLWEDDNNEAE